ncbi:MAG TPA: ATP-binding protein [Gammaproteobacteria bacterium]|nr:ATP-binding protein [Gammaproteobacteria bacterium]
MDLSGQLAKTLLDLAPDATVIVDASGRVVFANAQIERTFGYGPAELVGRPVEALLPERFRAAHPRHREQFASKPRLRPMGAGLSLHGLHKDGREFPVEISLSPVDTGEGLLVVAAIRDATARQDKEDRLVEANRSKSRFLAAASHDLRQPLQTLNLLNRAAVRQAGTHTPLQGILERQQRALDSMSALLASVLDISKLDSGTVVANPAPCALDEIFEQLRSDFEPQAADKGLRLIVERCPEAANTDRELLRRLIGNLLSNAIRYTNEGHVRLSCTAAGDTLYVEVRDTGIGIAPDQLERVFEEFYQVDRGTQRPEGLGLGLSIVRRLAALLQCAVTVESEPGRGTTFRVALPRAEIRVPEHVKAAGIAGACGGKVLVVDDEVEVAEATALLLELEGYAVSVASSQREALERVAAEPPDAIVSDYHLRGGETGLGVIIAVRHRLQRDVPVVFLTGDTARSALSETRVDRAVVLNKPVRADDLLDALRNHIAAQDASRRTAS